MDDLLSRIEHTLLHPAAQPADIIRLCQEALDNRLGGVCIQPVNVGSAARYLQGTGIRVVSVIGFPHGATTSKIKALEAEEAVNNGATELDMVINIGKLRAGELEAVVQDIAGVVAAGAPTKVILETSYLTREEKIGACRLAEQAGAQFVKTSTGFGGEGATLEDVTLLRQVVGQRLGVKAAGGIRDLTAAQRMIAVGADRLGSSNGVGIAVEWTKLQLHSQK